MPVPSMAGMGATKLFLEARNILVKHAADETKLTFAEIHFV